MNEIILSNFSAIFEISTDFFATDGTGAAFMLWGYMRDFANVLLIVSVIAIIFSQLTGVGIDNYGIKKILPKLIISAILINLSFIVCQLAVDVSNFLGSGIESLLKNTAEEISNTLGFSGVTATFSWILEVVFGVGGAAVALSGVALTIFAAVGSTIWVWLLPLILCIVIALLAVALFFILLSARKLLIIVCVAVSPLAFLCLIFPNTQSLFKKWWKLSEGLLLIYPICGGLYGLSKILKVIAYSSEGDIFMGMVAITVGFLPFFLAPTLLRRSMGAIGAAFGRLQSGITRSGRAGINSIQNSAAGQEAILRNQVGRAQKSTKRFENLQAKVKNGTASKKEERMAGRKWRQNRYVRQMEFLNSAKGRTAAMPVGDRVAMAADEAYDYDINAGLTSWRRNGFDLGGGIMGSAENIDDLDAVLDRYKDQETLSEEDERNIAIAARALLSTPGGGGKVTSYIRGEKTSSSAFQSAMQNSYNRDAKVRAALSQKDARANYFMEKKGFAGGTSYASFMSDVANAEAADKRVTNDEQGFNQSGRAFDEYLEKRFGAQYDADGHVIGYTNQEAIGEVMAGIGSSGYLSSLKNADKDKIRQAARLAGYTPTPTPTPTPAPVPNPAPARPAIDLGGDAAFNETVRELDRQVNNGDAQSRLEASVNAELRRQRNNEQQRGRQGGGIILP